MAFSDERYELREVEARNRSRSITRSHRRSGVLRRIYGVKAATPAHPLLSDVVERIVDWDVPDSDVARTLAPKTAPSTAPFVVVQYRAPFGSDHPLDSGEFRQERYVHVATVVRSGAPVLRPSGALGAVVVRLKPEAAIRLIGDRMQDFFNQKIDLSNLFKASELSQLEDVLREAHDSASRFASVENFLLRNLREARPLSVACRAAQCLRHNPTLPVRRLAAQLEVSERHLSRTFRAMYGAGPKEFARFARLEKVVTLRQGGLAWADIAFACGFADQAHMIRDFEAVIGESPQQFFRATHPALVHETDAATREILADRPGGQVICQPFG